MRVVSSPARSSFIQENFCNTHPSEGHLWKGLTAGNLGRFPAFLCLVVVGILPLKRSCTSAAFSGNPVVERLQLIAGRQGWVGWFWQAFYLLATGAPEMCVFMIVCFPLAVPAKRVIGFAIVGCYAMDQTIFTKTSKDPIDRYPVHLTPQPRFHHIRAHGAAMLGQQCINQFLGGCISTNHLSKVIATRLHFEISFLLLQHNCISESHS